MPFVGIDLVDVVVDTVEIVLVTVVIKVVPGVVVKPGGDKGTVGETCKLGNGSTR